jgi:hypothetical protein
VIITQEKHPSQQTVCEVLDKVFEGMGNKKKNGKVQKRP